MRDGAPLVPGPPEARRPRLGLVTALGLATTGPPDSLGARQPRQLPGEPLGCPGSPPACPDTPCPVPAVPSAPDGGCHLSHHPTSAGSRDPAHPTPPHLGAGIALNPPSAGRATRPPLACHPSRGFSPFLEAIGFCCRVTLQTGPILNPSPHSPLIPGELGAALPGSGAG